MTGGDHELVLFMELHRGSPIMNTVFQSFQESRILRCPVKISSAHKFRIAYVTINSICRQDKYMTILKLLIENEKFGIQMFKILT